MKRQKGFTLVELLVVISIMAILTVITVSQFTTAKKKAHDVQRKGDLGNLSKSLQMYFTDYGYFPVADKGMIEGVSWGGEFVDKDYVYMKVVPKENYLKIPYCYATEGVDKPKKYAIYAALENDQDSDYNNQNNGNNYTCGGRADYNYVILSPNAALSDINSN
jgi:general secretion pathway protein G